MTLLKFISDLLPSIVFLNVFPRVLELLVEAVTRRCHTSLRVVYVVSIGRILGVVLGKLYILLGPLRIFSYVTR